MQTVIKKLATHKSSQLLMIFIIQGISAVLGFAVQFILARNISVEAYGQFSILFNAITIFTLIISFGSSNYILRYISIYNEHKNRCKVELQTALLFILVNWAVFSILAISAYHLFIADTLLSLSPGIVFLSALWLLFATLGQLFQNFDRALGYAIRSMFPNSVFKSIFILGGLSLFIWLLTIPLRLIDIIGIYVLAFVLVALIFLIYERSYIKLGQFFRRSIIRYRLFFRNSYQYFINTICQSLLKNLDVILIGLFLTSYDAGIYGAANRINIVIIFGLASLNILYSPQVAKLFKQNKIKELNESLKTPNWTIFIFSLLFFLIIALFGKHILQLFGESYIQGYWVLLFLSLRNFIEAFFGITGSVLNMSGNQKYFNKILYVILAVYILLSPFAIKLWGIEGLAFFTAIIALGKNFVQWRFIYFKLGIRSGLFSNLFHRFIG